MSKMKKRYMIYFVIFIFCLFYTIDARAPCCEGVCHEGGMCCCPEGGSCEENERVWYIGCDFDTGIACPDEVLDDCLACDCSSPDDCEWVDYGNLLCSQAEQCQTCSYDNLDNPSFSLCQPISDCVIEEVCYLVTQHLNESCCYGPNQIDPIYGECLQFGEIVDNLCYYGSQTNNCTDTGWVCGDGPFFDCGSLDDFEPIDNNLAMSIATVDTCTSLCNGANCCETTSVICDNDCTDNFCVTASTCGERFTVRGIEYYCHNDNGEFYIDTEPSHPEETCDDGYNNNCDGLPDGAEPQCQGSCLLSSAEWSTGCAFDGDQINLIVKAENEFCDERYLDLNVWEEDDGIKDPTFNITQIPTVTFSGLETNIVWSLEEESDRDDEIEEDTEYKFTASIGGASVITADYLIVNFCGVGDSDCDGEPDVSDECPDTISCAEMSEESPGCSVEKAKVYSETYDVPGLGFSLFSFLLFVLVLSAFLVYNFERIS